MSDATQRDEIAAAVNTIDGLNCSPWVRQTLKPRDAIVQFVGATRADNGFGYMNRWQVLVVLPQDLRAAEDYLADHLGAIIEATETALIVTTVTPHQLTIDGGTVPCVVIEGTRARD